MIYADTSALAKLVRREAESADLVEWFASRPGVPCCTSVIGEVELLRAAHRSGEARTVARARSVLDGIATVPMSATVRQLAASLPPRALRTLDALHLATALTLGSDLEHFVAYDDRLLAAARGHGLPACAVGRTAAP